MLADPFTESRCRGRRLLIVLAVGLTMVPIVPMGVVLAVEPGHAPLCGPPPPGQVFPVHVTEPAEGVARITWPGDSSYQYDIVRGSLAGLSATGGDYALATQSCLADDVLGDVLDDADLPDMGDGFWYLLRADYTSGCGFPAASYVNPDGYPVTDVDIAIRSSGRDCTCYLYCQQP